MSSPRLSWGLSGTKEKKNSEAKNKLDLITGSIYWGNPIQSKQNKKKKKIIKKKCSSWLQASMVGSLSSFMMGDLWTINKFNNPDNVTQVLGWICMYYTDNRVKNELHAKNCL